MAQQRHRNNEDEDMDEDDDVEDGHPLKQLQSILTSLTSRIIEAEMEDFELVSVRRGFSMEAGHLQLNPFFSPSQSSFSKRFFEKIPK